MDRRQCSKGFLKLWDLASGREIKTFEGHSGFVFSVAFSPDGKTALSGGGDKTLRLWDLTSGREIKTFEGHSNWVRSVAFSPDGKTVLSGSGDNTIKLWDLASGRETKRFEGHLGNVFSVAFSPDGKTALTGSDDGTVRLWDLRSGEALASLSMSREGDQLALTPNGFFTASQRDTSALAIVRGLEITNIGQVYQSLFNPDLVREALAGDPDGEVKRAAAVVNLDKVLDAGPPPAVTITSHEPGSRSGKDLVTVAGRITDRGKGIGRIEWRMNGVTAGVMGAPQGPGPTHRVTKKLALDPGENRIELIVYEGRNLLASPPAQTTIVYDGPADKTKPKLYILAIGIDHYAGWPQLYQSVADARGFVAEMQKAAAPLYSEVKPAWALEGDATKAGLEKIVSRLAKDISPRDTFVFYAAGHGYSVDGRFYLIPQDYLGGVEPEVLARTAIGQEELQDWIANRIKAKKALILLDTCRSGSLTSGYTRSRVDKSASEAALGRLNEATGRPVLTAAGELENAKELGKLGHGVFTYALIDALHHAHADENGYIRVSDIAAHVEDLVPKLVKGGGARSVIVRPGSGGDDTQSAHFGSTGEDFALVVRLP